MPTLRIQVNDAVWPTVLAALDAAAGPIPPAADVTRWAEQVAADWFAAEIAAVVDPPAPRHSPGRRIRPSRVRT